MTQVAQESELQSRMQQLNDVLRHADEIADPAARSRTGEIIQGLMDFHGAGLAAILDRLARAGEAGQKVLADLAADDLVSSMLVLYDLHPSDLSARVRLAIEKVRPQVAGHGGTVEIAGVSDDGVVRLRLQMRAGGHSCPSSTAALKKTIEDAVFEKAPDAAAVQLEGAGGEPTDHPAGFVPLEQLTFGNGRHHTRHPLEQGITS